MNLSLVAVFVSILFMGGIVERLFREFSITLVACIVISLVVSVTLTPMLCARWLGHRPDEQRNLWQRTSERAFGALLTRLRSLARLGPRATRRSSSACSSASWRSTCTSTSSRPRASCRSRTPARSAGSSAETTACRSR